MTVFYLLRHAHAHWTLDESRPLSPQGQSDAGRVAEALAEYPISAIYSSPARRARQTIEPLAARLGLPIHTVPALRERLLSPGPVDDFLAAVQATWDNFSFAHPGGESNAAAQQRGAALLERLRTEHPTGHVVLGTHGNLLALVLEYFFQWIDFAFWQSLTMPDLYQLDLSRQSGAILQRLWPFGRGK